MSQVELARFQVSRRSLPWMLAAVVASLLPHLTHIPAWLGAVVLGCVAWRWLVHSGRAAYPSRRLQSVFALALLVLVLAHYRTVAGHEAGTALLCAMYGLKLLEMYRERDAYVVIFIGYFVAGTAFLFHFDVAMGGYVLLVSLLFTASLVSINEGLYVARFEPLRRALVILLQSIPVAVVLFVVMPRLGPLWSMGLKPSDAQTGISDVISLGDIGKLGRNEALAFRVEFDGAIPANPRLYWRGLTLGEFDGRSWRQGDDLERFQSLTDYPGRGTPEWRKQLQAMLAANPDAPRVGYTVVMEPTQRNWLFTLGVPLSEARDVGLVYDYRLRKRFPIKVRERLQVSSVLDVPRDLAPPDWLMADNLRLPETGNPRSLSWARQLRAERSDDAAYIEAVLDEFRRSGFRYTLEPPPLGEQAIDEFFFGTKRGFCEHYASTFVFMMRAGGIPARIVAGYQGGTFRELGNYLEVRQSDAHAWAEVWLAGRGWVEIDPTSVVAPERIDDGIEAFSEDAAAARDAAGTLLGRVGELADWVNHSWNKWVLGFDDSTQRGFLTRWLGKYSPWRIAAVLFGTGVLVALLVTLWMYRAALLARPDPVLREYHRFCAAWQRRGHALREGEAPLQYAARLQQQAPTRALDIGRFIARFTELAYAGKTVDRAALKALRSARVSAT